MPTTPTKPEWGRCWVNATREAPRIVWGVLTDAQVDVLYLACVVGMSTRQIAAEYRRSQPVIVKHLRRARERLSQAGLYAPPVPRLAPHEGGVCCPGCPHPKVPCELCIESLMRQHP